MKRIFLVAFAALALGACAYKSQPVYDVNKPLAAQSLSLDRIESLIMEAGTPLNWKFQRAGAGHLVATQQQPKFAATVDIYFDQQNYKTDNGNLILDCHGLTLLDPPAMEAELNNVAGVVTNGIFARRPADVLLLGDEQGVKTFTGK